MTIWIIRRSRDGDIVEAYTDHDSAVAVAAGINAAAHREPLSVMVLHKVRVESCMLYDAVGMTR